jgi:hypothetical protein
LRLDNPEKGWKKLEKRTGKKGSALLMKETLLVAKYIIILEFYIHGYVKQNLWAHGILAKLEVINLH